MCLERDSIFSVSTNGKLISTNAINGKRNWAIDMSGYRTPTISGGQIYVIDEDGKLICLNKNTGEVELYDVKTDKDDGHRKRERTELQIKLGVKNYYVNLHKRTKRVDGKVEKL